MEHLLADESANYKYSSINRATTLFVKRLSGHCMGVRLASAIIAFC
jgi:hypothetical protein